MTGFRRVKSVRVVDPGSPPDIDTDFADIIRRDVIEHLMDTYGHDRVAYIGTYNTYAGRSALNKAASLYGLPVPDARAVSATIPAELKSDTGVINGFLDDDSEIYDVGNDFRELTSDASKWGDVVSSASVLENRIASSGQHPCGMVISAKPLRDVTPIHEKKIEGTFSHVTQWEYPELEAMGLIKMDILGLTTISLIMKTVQMCLRSGYDVDGYDMEAFVAGGLKDPAAYEIFSSGRSMGIFQFSNPAVREICRQVKPTTVEDIADITALYRPGPMDADAHNDYWKIKHGIKQKELPHKDFKDTVVEEIFAQTHYVLVYQEQVMELASRGCGMTLQEADTLRKAMGKKNLVVMNRMGEKFIAGGMKNMGVSEEAMKALWDLIVPFAGYAFNKSHAIAYAYNAVQAAYLKAHYPREFIAASLDMKFGGPSADEARAMLSEAATMGIEVRPVDINKSLVSFAPDTDTDEPVVYYGLGNIMIVSETVAEAIVKERDENGPFISVSDFLKRMTAVNKRYVNRRIVKNLALAGAFDSLGVTRKAVVEGFDDWLSSVKAREKMDSLLSMSLFDVDELVDADPSFDSEEEYPFADRIQMEASVAKVYLSEHPMSRLKHGVGKLKENRSKRSFEVTATVFSVERKKSKKGADQWLFVLDDSKTFLPVRASRSLSHAFASNEARRLVRSSAGNVADGLKKKAVEEFAREPFQQGRVYRFKVQNFNNKEYSLVDGYPLILDEHGQESEPVYIPLYRDESKKARDRAEAIIETMGQLGGGDRSLVGLMCEDPVLFLDDPEMYRLMTEYDRAPKEGWWSVLKGRLNLSEDVLYRSILHFSDRLNIFDPGSKCDNSAEAYYRLPAKMRSYFDKTLFEGDHVSFGSKTPGGLLPVE